jgi:hypothetical protein
MGLETATGSLAEAELNALMAATRALVGDSVDASRYSNLFRWRAENQPGYRHLYGRFRSSVDARAREAAGRPFAECDQEVCNKLLQDAFGTAAIVNDDKLPNNASIDEWDRYKTNIAAEILQLFAKTDAWVLLGYEFPPGVPRGLDLYQHAPVSRPSSVVEATMVGLG